MVMAKCGFREKSNVSGFTWECIREEHEPRKVLDAQGRVVREVPDHWFRRVKEDE
jgi:hypothetical protein